MCKCEERKQAQTKKKTHSIVPDLFDVNEHERKTWFNLNYLYTTSADVGFKHNNFPSCASMSANILGSKQVAKQTYKEENS